MKDTAWRQRGSLCASEDVGSTCGSGPCVHLAAPDCAVDLHALYSAEPRLTRTWRSVSWVLPLVQLMPPGAPDVRLAVSEAPFEPPAALAEALAGPIARLRAHPDRHDGTLTALLALETRPDGTVRGQVAPVSYFCTRALESLLDGPHDLRARDQPAPGLLASPARSMLACDIGVVVILRTSDHRVVAQRRSDRVDWRAGHLSVSASGSLEPGRDFGRAEVDLTGLLAGARRELAEELGVGGPLDPCRDDLVLRSLGIWRELQRGGKPELYAEARTPLTFEQVQLLHAQAPDRFESARLSALDAEACAAVLDGVARHGLGSSGHALGPVDLALVAALLLVAHPPG